MPGADRDGLTAGPADRLQAVGGAIVALDSGLGHMSGKRLKVRDYSRAKNSPELELSGYRLTLWDGAPSICDTYN